MANKMFRKAKIRGVLFVLNNINPRKYLQDSFPDSATPAALGLENIIRLHFLIADPGISLIIYNDLHGARRLVPALKSVVPELHVRTGVPVGVDQFPFLDQIFQHIVGR